QRVEEATHLSRQALQLGVERCEPSQELRLQLVCQGLQRRQRVLLLLDVAEQPLVLLLQSLQAPLLWTAMHDEANFAWLDDARHRASGPGFRPPSNAARRR